LEQPFVLIPNSPEGTAMTNIAKFLVASATIGTLAAPAAAQYYPQPTYPQQYPQQYPPGYPQQAYPGYGQGYAQGYSQNPVQQIIDSLLGNRYSVTDRQAVSRCASAALTQAQARYGGGYGGYGNGYGQGYGQQYGQQYGYGFNRIAGLRVTAITEVERRSYGLRVSGLLGSGARYGGNGYGAYGGQYGTQGQGYEDQDDQGQGYARGYAANRLSLSFRCNVDYNGSVTGVRVRPANSYRG
jgi:hypothetical protein